MRLYCARSMSPKMMESSCRMRLARTLSRLRRSDPSRLTETSAAEVARAALRRERRAARRASKRPRRARDRDRVSPRATGAARHEADTEADIETRLDREEKEARARTRGETSGEARHAEWRGAAPPTPITAST